MLRHYVPLQTHHLCSTDSETESDDHFIPNKTRRGGVLLDNYRSSRREKCCIDEESHAIMRLSKEESAGIEEAMNKKARKYQEYMKKIPIPSIKGLPITFFTWQGLAESLKQMYEQPLHYLTYKLLQEWDHSRIGTPDECKPLDCIFHPSKAEATIWVMEEVHRQCTSHHHLANLWLSDPVLYSEFVHPIISTM
ncbi:hypothetical protein K2173_003844 [Erythroxylum novogranatense]|uniref:Protein RDM1 n=1 Tax=Erythroxylum novogranatense TaxID=1862640 RepID=A0AAV8S432_9ROSI|nr:hypothetical protein K2173_003844 [Erythroxylum novogranatense]